MIILLLSKKMINVQSMYQNMIITIIQKSVTPQTLFEQMYSHGWYVVKTPESRLPAPVSFAENITYVDSFI